MTRYTDNKVLEVETLKRLTKDELISNTVTLRDIIRKYGEKYAAERERRVASDYERGGLLVEVQLLRNKCK
jgi:hypothetical protein